MSASNASLGFRDLLRSGRFVYGVEVVTTRGPLTDDRPQDVVGFARGLLDDPRIGWISITDNPGGGPMLPPDWLAGKFAGRGAQHRGPSDLQGPQSHGLEAAAWRYASEGFHNILALTGDYPTAGFRGLPNPVFDLDSGGLIALLRAMNEGLEVPGRGGKKGDFAQDRLLHRRGGLAFQAARARVDAAVLQAPAQDSHRSAVDHSAVGIRHAEVPRDQVAAGFAGDG